MRTAEQASRRYDLDEHFFDSIDTEEKAYWLGFVVADGYITPAGSIKLGLQERDRSHIEKFRAALKSDMSIRSYNYGDPYAIMEVRSKTMFAALQRLGVACLKPKRAVPDVREDLLRHYWRGAFDADGTLTNYPKCSRYKDTIYVYDSWGAQFTGNLSAVMAFERFVGENTGLRAHVGSYKDGSNRATYGNKGASIVASLLYNGCNYFLDRKKVLAERISLCFSEES